MSAQSSRSWRGCSRARVCGERQAFSFCPRSGLIRFAAHLFHPVRAPAADMFHNSDMRHGRGGRGAMPVLFAGLDPDNVARPDLPDRTTPASDKTAASRRDQCLAQRVRVPCRPSARFKRHQCAKNARRIRRVDQRINTHRSGEISAGPLTDGCEPLLFISIVSTPSCLSKRPIP